MSETRKLFESFKQNLNESYLVIEESEELKENSDYREGPEYNNSNFYSDYELETFWQDRLNSPNVSSGTIAHILLKVHDWLGHESVLHSPKLDKEGKRNDEFYRILPILTKNAIDYGIDEESFNLAVNYVKTIDETGEEPPEDKLPWNRKVNKSDKLKEDAHDEVYNMNMEDMKKKYAELCEKSGISFYDALEQLDSYDCLNTGSFRSMLIDTINYLNDNY